MAQSYLPISYLPILVLMIIAFIFGAGSLAISWIVGPKHPNPQKLDAYECGMVPIGSTWQRFPIRFYLVAMLFILFDIEVVFLYPWIVAFRSMRGMEIFMFIELAVFVGILVVGYLYIWRKGALEWD